MWKEILLGAGVVVGAPALAFLIAKVLPREKTKAFGIKIGRFISRILRQKTGKVGEKTGEMTINDLMDGIQIGMAEDNDRIIIKQMGKTENEEEKRSLKERLSSIVK